MKYSLRILFFSALCWCAFAGLANGSVIFKPGEKAKYLAPGEEEVSGSAQELLAKAQAAEKEGDISGAIKAYRSLVRRHPHDHLAPGALWRMGQLLEQKHDYLKAAQSYDVLAEKFPKSEHFDDSIAAMFRIGEIYLAGRKIKILGIPFKGSMDEAASIFQAIVRAAPYGKYAPRALFNIGRAREKQGANEAAIGAYQNVIEKFPNDPVAADAQYQIGYIYSQASRNGTYDPNATNKAKTGFEDFLYRHPNSEKSAQARENLKTIEHQQTSNAFDIARFYDKQKKYRAAAIYYNDVIRQQPDSKEGDHAKKRISELRAKYGDAALQPPAVSAATADKKNKKSETAAASSNRSSQPDAHTDAPLPSADIDLSLPPPASLMPDTTTAPPPSSSTLDTAEPLPKASDSAAPEAAAPESEAPEPAATPE